MSGFSGGSGNALSDLIRQVQGQQGQTGQTPASQPPAQSQGVGPGEPQPQYTGAYNQQGMYNTLAQDMSRGRMGGYGFGGNQFSYQPFGNPYQQQSPFGGMFGRGGYGGGYGGYGWGGPPPRLRGGMGNAMGQYQNMRQSMGPFRGGMLGGSPDYSEGSYNAVPQMMGNHQYTGGMGNAMGQYQNMRNTMGPMQGGYFGNRGMF